MSVKDGRVRAVALYSHDGGNDEEIAALLHLIQKYVPKLSVDDFPHFTHISQKFFCHEVNLGRLGLCLDRLRNGGCDVCTELLASMVNVPRPKTNWNCS